LPCHPINRFPFFVGRSLIIRLVIQTIRRARSGSVQIDGAPDVSRPDRSGADQIDVEHQATDLAVGLKKYNSSERPLSALLCGAARKHDPESHHEDWVAIDPREGLHLSLPRKVKI
jgi:hypothetical protein